MTNDSGVYILRTRLPSNIYGFEYRVAHVSSFQKLWLEDKSDWNEAEIKSAFGTSMVFENQDTAMRHAVNVFKELSENAIDCQYGIVELKFRRKIFP